MNVCVLVVHAALSVMPGSCQYAELKGLWDMEQDSPTFNFKSPCLNLMQVGDLLEACVTVTKCSGKRTIFATHCTHRQTGRVLVDGTALALLHPNKRD